MLQSLCDFAECMVCNMERLTTWNDKTEGAELISWNEEEWKDFIGSLDVPICTELSLAIDKLAEYEDLEEQGLLLRLPCKVEDTAYYVHKEYLKNADRWIKIIDEVKVDSFVINANVLVNVSFYIGCDIFRKTLTPYKTLFFTKEEAEQALERMVKENG